MMEDITWAGKILEIFLCLTVVWMVLHDHRLRDCEGLTSYDRIRRRLPVFYQNIILQEIILMILACAAIGVALSGHVVVSAAVITLIPIRIRQARSIDNLRLLSFRQ